MSANQRITWKPTTADAVERRFGRDCVRGLWIWCAMSSRSTKSQWRIGMCPPIPRP